MDLFEAIDKRHSYRGDFTPDPVPEHHLRKIVQAGIQAATALNEQVTSFLIVTEPTLRRQIAEIVDRSVCNTAPAMIAVVTDPRPVLHGVSYATEDYAAATENMLLAITALGYATVWLDGVLRSEQKAARIAALLGLPEDRNLRVLLPLGVPVEGYRPKEKLPFEQRAWFNRYGSR